MIKFFLKKGQRKIPNKLVKRKGGKKYTCVRTHTHTDTHRKKERKKQQFPSDFKYVVFFWDIKPWGGVQIQRSPTHAHREGRQAAQARCRHQWAAGVGGEHQCHDFAIQSNSGWAWPLARGGDCAL